MSMNQPIEQPVVVIAPSPISAPPVKRSFGLSKHAGAGAMLAVVPAVLGVLHYLFTTQIGIGVYGGTSLYSYVSGTAYNMKDIAPEALFVMTARFVLAFCLCWGPFTTVIALIRG